MKFGIDVVARHCLEAVRPEFAAACGAATCWWPGANFGIGSSREQAASVLVHLGVAAVMAPSRLRAVLPQRLQPRPAAADLPADRRIGEGESISPRCARRPHHARRRRGAGLRAHARLPARHGRTPVACVPQLRQRLEQR
jgi:hypothetical protein